MSAVRATHSIFLCWQPKHFKAALLQNPPQNSSCLKLSFFPLDLPTKWELTHVWNLIASYFWPCIVKAWHLNILYICYLPLKDRYKMYLFPGIQPCCLKFNFCPVELIVFSLLQFKIHSLKQSDQNFLRFK